MTAHDCDVQAARALGILAVFHANLLEQVNNLDVPMVDCVVQAVEALWVSVIYRVTQRTLHQYFHYVFPIIQIKHQIWLFSKVDTEKF